MDFVKDTLTVSSQFAFKDKQSVSTSLDNIYKSGTIFAEF